MQTMRCALGAMVIAAGCGGMATSARDGERDSDEELVLGEERLGGEEPLPFYVGEWVLLERESAGVPRCVHDSVYFSLAETRFVMTNDGGDNEGLTEGEVLFDGTTATLRPDGPFITLFVCAEADLTRTESGGLHFEGRDCDRDEGLTAFDLEPVPQLPGLEIPEGLVGYFDGREAVVEHLGPDGVEVIRSETVPTDDCRGPGGHWTLTLGVEGEADRFAGRAGWHAVPGFTGGLASVDSGASEALFLFLEGPAMCHIPQGVTLRYDLADGRIVAEHLYQSWDVDDVDDDGVHDERLLTRWTHTLVPVEELPDCS